MLLAIVVSLTLPVVEALVTGGWDNLLVPVSAWGLLKGLNGVGQGTMALLAAGAMAAVLSLVLAYALLPTLSVGRGQPVKNSV